MEMTQGAAMMQLTSTSNIRALGRRISSWFTVLISVAVLAACSGDSFVSDSSGSQTPGQGSGGSAPGCTDPTQSGCVVNANYLSLTLSAQQIKSDGSDSTTIIATVLDQSRAAIKNAQVRFAADVGKLNSAVVFTDANGLAQVQFSADASNPANQVATVSATVTGVGTATIPVEIIGTTVEISVANTSLKIPSGSTSISQAVKVTVKNAGGQRVYNVPVVLAVAASGGAGATLSTALGLTNTRGEVDLTMTVTGSGAATLTAQSLGAQASTAFTVANIVADNPFRITSPTTNPTPLVANGSTLTVTVAATGVTGNVRFSTTIGEWSNNQNYIDVPPAGGVASAVLQSNPGNQGFATIVASDANNPAVFDSITVAMSPPVSAAAQLMLQSDVNVLPPSTSTTTYEAKLQAKVVTNDGSGNYPIYNVPVVFSLSNTSGGGETLTTAYATTDLNGVVTTNLKSGVLPSGQKAVTVTATVVGQAISDSVNITIGGTGGSVVLGTATKVELDDENHSKYAMDMSAQVADSNGNAVAGSNVTLSLWPYAYYSGVWYDSDPDPDSEKCVVYYSGGPYTFEDRDEDLILDRPPAAGVDEDVNLDGELTPHNSAAGTIPSTVQTNSMGIAFFKHHFLKQYAQWLDVRARGRTKVQGTETTGTLIFKLKSEKVESEACFMPDSPYRLTLSGQLSDVATDTVGGSTYEFKPIAGTDVSDMTLSISKGTFLANGPPVTSVNYVIPATLPADAQPLSALYGSAYSSTIYEYSDQATVGYTIDCGGVGVCEAGISAQFPIRVLVDCSATPGVGGCP